VLGIAESLPLNLKGYMAFDVSDFRSASFCTMLGWQAPPFACAIVGLGRLTKNECMFELLEGRLLPTVPTPAPVVLNGIPITFVFLISPLAYTPFILLIYYYCIGLVMSLCSKSSGFWTTFGTHLRYLIS